MDCFLLQDWVCLRGNFTPSAVTSIVQSDECWLDMEPYTDIVAFLGVREFTNPTTGATNVCLDIQTAPVRDELYFTSMIGGNGQALATNAGGPPTVINLSRDFAAVPLSRWLRWTLNTGGTTPTQIWDATFCVWIAANYRAGASPGVGANGPGSRTSGWGSQARRGMPSAFRTPPAYAPSNSARMPFQASQNRPGRSPTGR